MTIEYICDVFIYGLKKSLIDKQWHHSAFFWVKAVSPHQQVLLYSLSENLLYHYPKYQFYRWNIYGKFRYHWPVCYKRNHFTLGRVWTCTVTSTAAAKCRFTAKPALLSFIYQASNCIQPNTWDDIIYTDKCCCLVTESECKAPSLEREGNENKHNIYTGTESDVTTYWIVSLTVGSSCFYLVVSHSNEGFSANLL